MRSHRSGESSNSSWLLAIVGVLMDINYGLLDEISYAWIEIQESCWR